MSDSMEADPFMAAMEANSSPPRSPSPLPAQLTPARHPASASGEDRESSADGQGPHNDDSESGSTSQTPAPLISAGNLVLAARRYAERKRLRSEQVVEVEHFVQSGANEQLFKLFINQLALQNKIDKIVVNTAPFQVTDDLKKNIHEYSISVLLSSKIRAYKGDVPRDHVLDVLKKFRPGLPLHIEQIPSDWSKVVSAVSDALTQIRSQWKKNLKASLLGDKDDSMDIYTLALLFVRKTTCKVTVPLACRVAMMRALYVSSKDDSDDFWDSVDKRLAWIRKMSDGDARKVKRAFMKYLGDDRKAHGSDATEIDDDDVDERQQSVDEIIEGIVVAHA